jgi:NADH-quinone oxidoreductase subunit N
MVSISRPLPAAQEAGVKYFFLCAMAAAVMLFGFSYLYGTTGKTKLDEITASIDATRPTRESAARAAGGQASSARPPATQSAAAQPDAAAQPRPDEGPVRFWGGWHAPQLSAWHAVAIVMLLAGLAFKIAAVPMHAYAGDVYQGAATPVTAFLAFVPKTSGFVAILKVLAVVGGSQWAQPDWLVKLLWVAAAFTMTVGNVLAMVQPSNGNVKRVLAYSSVAHSGYMLVGVTALVQAARVIQPEASQFSEISQARAVQSDALAGVLFYLAAYGVMNAGAFGVLMLLPSRATSYALGTHPYSAGARAYGGGVSPRAARHRPPPATTAETFEDLAGQGRRHPLLGLAMAVCCFSLIGLPLTVGFVGKFYLIKPALEAGLMWLVVLTLINAAVSAAYYLRIVATMFLRPAPDTASDADDDARFQEEAEAPGVLAYASTGSPAAAEEIHRPARWPWPIATAVALSAIGTVVLGAFFPATTAVSRNAATAQIESQPQVLTPAPDGDAGR